MPPGPQSWGRACTGAPGCTRLSASERVPDRGCPGRAARPGVIVVCFRSEDVIEPRVVQLQTSSIGPYMGRRRVCRLKRRRGSATHQRPREACVQTSRPATVKQRLQGVRGTGGQTRGGYRSSALKGWLSRGPTPPPTATEEVDRSWDLSPTTGSSAGRQALSASTDSYARQGPEPMRADRRIANDVYGDRSEIPSSVSSAEIHSCDTSCALAA